MKIKGIFALLIICLLNFQVPTYAASNHIQLVQFSKSNVSVGTNVGSFTVDILVTNDAPFSSAEFGLRLEKNITIQSVQYSNSIMGSRVNPTEKNGVYYFGFFDTSNKYNGTINICTVTFGYTGGSPSSVTLLETNITTITPDRGVSKETAYPNAVLQVTRSAPGEGSGGGSDNPPGEVPGGGSDNPPGEVPGGGSDNPPGGGVGGNLPPTDKNHFTYVLDNKAVLIALAQATMNKNNCKVITIDVTKESNSAKIVSVQFPYSLLDSAEKRCVTIHTPFTNIEVPSHVLTKEQAAHATNLTVTLENQASTLLSNQAQTKLGNHPIVHTSFAVDGQDIVWRNEEIPVKISIPYSPTSEESKNTDQLVVYDIDSNGNMHVISTSNYDINSSAATFTVHQFDSFGLAFVQNSFTDIRASWAKKEIEALASHEIITGTTATTFSPSVNITRADFTKLLVGVLDMKAQQKATDFSDVQVTSYYYDAVMTARALGLVTGAGDNKFNPKAQITRQEMMTLIDRALSIAGQPLSEKNSLSAFNDAKQLAPFAVDSAAKLVSVGLIQGTNGKLRPQDHLRRDEAAKVLYAAFKRLYQE